MLSHQSRTLYQLEYITYFEFFIYGYSRESVIESHLGSKIVVKEESSKIKQNHYTIKTLTSKILLDLASQLHAYKRSYCKNLLDLTKMTFKIRLLQVIYFQLKIIGSFQILFNKSLKCKCFFLLKMLKL